MTTKNLKTNILTCIKKKYNLKVDLEPGDVKTYDIVLDNKVFFDYRFAVGVELLSAK